jgi:hypothetical protein
MKKIYVKPATEVYEVELQSVITASPGIGLSSEDADGDCGAESDTRRRWGNLW